ncbi:TPA: taurine catabolism dioxygenase TauD [Candidatus Latescibacteria bacterium]|nr:taurine catabolism dioxygenase TauD [Candidatus Latescibacterota bacterium]
MPEWLPFGSMGDLTVNPTGAALGAFVDGVDLSEPLSETDRLYVQGAFWEHSVLVFRHQELTEAQQVVFSRYLCDPVAHPTNVTNVGELPEICIIANVEEDGKAVGALGNSEVTFHADLAFYPAPGTVSVLYAVEAPNNSGHTSWSSGIAAYDSLDAQSKDRLEDVRIVYSHRRSDYRSADPVIHPLVCTHPESGRKTLYFSSNHAASVVDEDEAESESLIDRLRSYTAEERFTWTHHWRPGDLVVWDNRSTQHRRSHVDESKRRYMRRTQAVGTPDGALAPQQEDV